MADDPNLERKCANVEDERYSCRCHTCSIEFPLLEELLVHVSQNHTNSDGSIECGECRDLFASTEDYIEHCRANHDEEIAKSVLSLAANVVAGNHDDQGELPTQITILNDDGGTVGLATNHIDENLNSSIVCQTTRKRRPSAKVREIVQHETNAKKSKYQQRLNATAVISKDNEVEIDVSDVAFVRLKTKNENKSNEMNEEILQYLERVDEKLNCILKHFNVPFHTSSNIVGTDSKKSIPKYSRTSMASSSSTSQSLVVPVRTAISPTETHEITHYIISEELLENTFLRSRNRGNFAKNLVYAAFPFDERVGRNCYGRRGGSLCGPKGPLEAAKLDAVRNAVFQKYPVLPGEEEEGVWKKECVIAIDTALRSEMRHRILSMNVKQIKTD